MKKIILLMVSVLIYGCSNIYMGSSSNTNSNITYFHGDEVFNSFDMIEEYTTAFYVRKGDNIFIRISHDNGILSGLGRLNIFLVGTLEGEQTFVVVSAYLFDYRFHPNVITRRLNVKSSSLKGNIDKKKILLVNLINKKGKKPQSVIKIILQNINLQKLDSLYELRKIDDIWTTRALKRLFPEY